MEQIREISPEIRSIRAHCIPIEMRARDPGR